MADEVIFGNTIVTVESEVVAKVTAFNKQASISEEDVTGAEDVVAGSNVLSQKFVSIAVGRTANVEGIVIESAASGRDDGQSELEAAASSGSEVTLRHTRNTGYGTALTGFFTSYEESGDTSGVYKFKGAFRVNTKTDIVPGS
jgi:hypothetical protein